MATNRETTVKISKWLVDEIEGFVKKNKRNMSEFPSKRNFVDRAVMSFLEREAGIRLNGSAKSKKLRSKKIAVKSGVKGG